MEKIFSLVAVLILITGCATTSTFTDERSGVSNQGKSIAVFLDGTGNDQISRTNVARLYELTVNQNRNDLAVFYTEGVGTDGRIIGALTGLGIGKDVRDAYKFISSNYTSDKDKIFIFGFSRGAYAGRALSGLIFSAGLADFTGIPEKGKEQSKIVDRFVDNLWDSYKGKMDSKKRNRQIEKTYRKYEERGIGRRKRVMIEVLGLWDTVEALGAPNFKENVGEVNRRYVDQICNINHAYHAVALDDNRARIYTPILLTGEHLTQKCPNVSLDKRVEEVWFSGAHADVGGGYGEGFLPGVSLNWMISKIRKYEILPESAGVYESPYDVVHDAEGANFAYKSVFKERVRSIDSYVAGSSYNNSKLTVHESVTNRLSNLNTQVASLARYRREQNEKLRTYDSEWYKDSYFADCFRETDLGFQIKRSCDRIVVVGG